MATHSSAPGLENPMDQGAWGTTVHRVAQSQTRVQRLSTQAIMLEGLTCC